MSPRPPDFDGEHGPLARRRVHDPVEDEGRRHDSVRRIVLRVQAIGAPQFAARRRIVAGDDVAAGDHDLFGRPVAEERRRGVGVRRFADGLGQPLLAPERLARGLVDLQDVRRVVGLHPVDAPARRARRRAEVEKTRSPSSARTGRTPSGCRGPRLPCPRSRTRAESPCRSSPTHAGHRSRARATTCSACARCGCRRSGAASTASCPLLRSTDHRWRSSPFSATLRKMRSPQMMAVEPDHAGSGEPPRDAFGLRPLDGQVGLAAQAVGRRSAPRRPVLGARRGGREEGEEQRELHGELQGDE